MATTTSMIAAQHRPVGERSGPDGRTIECACGHVSVFQYGSYSGAYTPQRNPISVVKNHHDRHVVAMVMRG